MFLDTSGLLAYLFAAEPAHTTAGTVVEGQLRKWTHNLVLAELVALSLARRYPREPVLGFVKDLLNHPLIEVVWVDRDLHERSMALLEARPDKGYSLCDAVSFVLMRDLNLHEALTTDQHFAQEGFIRAFEP